jgi:hypothetical protein
MRFLLILTAALFALTACQQKPSGTATANNSDTLVYKQQIAKKTTGPCKNQDDICASVEFSYPLFEGAGSESINKWVQNKMGEGYMDTLIHPDYHEVMEQFLASYDTILKSMPDYTLPWLYSKTIEVEKQAPGFVTLHVGTYEFAGGAHPNGADAYFHFDIKTGKELQMTDFLVSGGDAKLSKVAEGIFRKEFKLDEKINLDSAGFFFEHGQFSLPTNYTFTPEGIKFHYNDYEIRSHAEGPYDLVVPYTEIQDIAKPDTYLHNAAKAI